MKLPGRKIIFTFAMAASAVIAAPAALRAQGAAPGPIRRQPDATEAQPAPKILPPQKKENLAGSWKINPDESDNAHEKIAEARAKLHGGSASSKPAPTGGNNPGNNPPSTGPGNPGGNGPYPRTGQPYPGSGPGTNNPNAPSRNSRPYSSQPSLTDREQMGDLVDPATALTLTQKEGEVDVTDEQGRKRVYYTDGRTIQKVPAQQTSDNNIEASARWEGARLVADEIGPHGGKIMRTYELTPDGRQLIELVSLDNPHMGYVTIRYVFDHAAPATSAAATPASQ